MCCSSCNQVMLYILSNLLLKRKNEHACNSVKTLKWLHFIEGNLESTSVEDYLLIYRCCSRKTKSYDTPSQGWEIISLASCVFKLNRKWGLQDEENVKFHVARILSHIGYRAAELRVLQWCGWGIHVCVCVLYVCVCSCVSQCLGSHLQNLHRKIPE